MTSILKVRPSLRLRIPSGMVAASAIGLSLVLAACTTSGGSVPPAGQKVKVSAQVMEFYKEYQSSLSSTHTGAFAVSRSGAYAGYAYCPEQRCIHNKSAGQQAVEECNHGGEDCYVFATNRDIRFEYEVVP